MDKRTALLAVVTAVAVSAPADATAKGPAAFTLSGPGLAEPIRLNGAGVAERLRTVARLANRSGLYAALGGGSTWGFLAEQRPTAELGPRYTLTFVMPHGVSRTVRQDVYPYAEPGPVTYTPPGQRPFGAGRMGTGWYVADAGLRRALTEAGLPAAPPAAASDGFDVPSLRFLAAAIVVAVALAGGAALATRRRPSSAR